MSAVAAHDRDLSPVGRSPVVEMAGVQRIFEGPPRVAALRHSDLSIGAGEYVSIVGPSGSGKSTLLHLLGLLDRPTAGRYALDGIDTADLSDDERSALRGRRIGFVFQQFHLLAHRSALENVTLAQLYNRTMARQRRGRAIAALQQVGLGHRMDFLPTTLSGGERQRVAIARALVSQPSLLLADEPTGNLDSVTGDTVLDVLDGLHSDGHTIVVITHDTHVSARAERVYEMTDGVLAPRP